jgi:hypothetical protein
MQVLKRVSGEKLFTAKDAEGAEEDDPLALYY